MAEGVVGDNSYGSFAELTENEISELQAAKPSSEDVVDGLVDREKLATKMEDLLHRGRLFKDATHLKDFLLAFAGPWGFHVNRKGSSYICGRSGKEDSEAKNKNYTVASPQSKRKRDNAAKVGCPFIIRFSRVNQRDKEDLRIKISKHHPEDPDKGCNFHHSELCTPGVMSQVVARKASGYYAKAILKPAQLKIIVNLLDAGRVTPQLLRSLLQQYLPRNCPVSSTDLHNFRIRAKVLSYGKKDDEIELIHDTEKLFAALDDDDSLAKGDVMRCAKEVLRQTLRDGGAGWKIQLFLENLKKADPLFDYRICVDQDGAPTGVLWMTAKMKRDFLRYGDFMSLDAMKRQLNKLYWCYVGPCGYDNNNRLAQFSECLCVEESFDGY